MDLDVFADSKNGVGNTDTVGECYRTRQHTCKITIEKYYRVLAYRERTCNFFGRTLFFVYTGDEVATKFSDF